MFPPQPAAGPPESGYIAVTGRRWRGAAFVLPERLAADLVNEIFAGRQELRAATPGTAEYLAACERVADAERALGERGDRFDIAHTPEEQRDHAVSVIRALLRPTLRTQPLDMSDVVEVLIPTGWRQVHAIAYDALDTLIDAGVVVAVERGEVVRSIEQGPRFQ